MNDGIMPLGTPPTLEQMKKGARCLGKPYTIHESRLIKKHGTDLKTAILLEAKATKISQLL